MGTEEKSDAFGLLHDRVHRDAGGSRPAKTARREQSRAERIEAAAQKVVEEKGVLGQRSCKDRVTYGWRECRQRKARRSLWCQGCDLAQAIDDLAAALEGE